MPEHKYWIRWDDPTNPEVLQWQEGDTAEPKTLYSVKKEIINYFLALRYHCGEQITNVKALRAKNVSRL